MNQLDTSEKSLTLHRVHTWTGTRCLMLLYPILYHRELEAFNGNTDASVLDSLAYDDNEEMQ